MTSPDAITGPFAIEVLDAAGEPYAAERRWWSGTVLDGEPRPIIIEAHRLPAAHRYRNVDEALDRIPEGLHDRLRVVRVQP